MSVELPINPKTYLLIHGAWHAKWCWKYITPALEKHGHHIIAVDLPGHGDNEQDFREINLNTYVQYVMDIVKAQKSPVILVGHSMAGVIISQVAENIPELIERLVYVTAFIPQHHSSLIMEAKKSKTAGTSSISEINVDKNEIFLNDENQVKELFFNCCTFEDTIFALENLQKEPFKPMMETINISHERFGSVKKTYIECLADKAVTPESQRRMYANLKCDVVSILADHSPFFSAVPEMIEILLTNQLNKI